MHIGRRAGTFWVEPDPAKDALAGKSVVGRQHRDAWLARRILDVAPKAEAAAREVLVHGTGRLLLAEAPDSDRRWLDLLLKASGGQEGANRPQLPRGHGRSFRCPHAGLELRGARAATGSA